MVGVSVRAKYFISETTTENKYFFNSTLHFFAVAAVDFTDGKSLEKSGNSEKSEKLLRRGFKNWEERY